MPVARPRNHSVRAIERLEHLRSFISESDYGRKVLKCQRSIYIRNETSDMPPHHWQLKYMLIFTNHLFFSGDLESKSFFLRGLVNASASHICPHFHRVLLIQQHNRHKSSHGPDVEFKIANRISNQSAAQPRLHISRAEACTMGDTTTS